MKLKFILCCFCFASAIAVNNSPQSVSTMQSENTHATYSSLPNESPEGAGDLNPPINSYTMGSAISESRSASSSNQKINTVNKIVAFVNKSVITSNQINAMVSQTMQGFKQKGVTNPPDLKDVQARVLDQLIMEQIQLDLAVRSGIKTNDIEINDAINNMAKAQNISVDALKSNIAKQGVSYSDFRNQLQKQITMEKLKQREVDARVVVNDDEVNRVLNSEAYKVRVDYRLAMINIGLPEQPTAEIIKQKEDVANKAYDELRANTSFEKVAIKYSTNTNVLNGGDIGWRSSATLPPIIANSLKNVSIGGYTQVIKLPVGFFIFRVVDIKKHGTVHIVKQYKVRHILIKVNENTSDDEAQQKIKEIKAKLDKDINNPTQLNTDFIKYAKEYSEDTSSINGGDIGWVSNGDTVPQFEQTILKTPTGVVSNPVRTQFGWHILQVIGVRDSNLTNDREKADIRQELRDNKATMLYTQWIRDIREMAYVKINDE